MEEKILIKSETNESIKKFLRIAPLVLIGIAILLSLILCAEFEYKYSYYSYYGGGYISSTRKDIGWELAFELKNVLCFMIFIIAALSLLSGIIIGIIYLINRECELTVTEKNVKGKTILGKEVVLPLYMISAYSTSKYLSSIAVATSSGITKFALIENYAEIGNVLSKKINERQENTSNESKSTIPQSNSIDDIIKLKSMLDSGIITQEEFEAKKKQLLGL